MSLRTILLIVLEQSSLFGGFSGIGGGGPFTRLLWWRRTEPGQHHYSSAARSDLSDAEATLRRVADQLLATLNMYKCGEPNVSQRQVDRPMGKRTVIVNDKMQKGYRYRITEPAGRNFDPEFRPQLKPKEMLALGVFCGKYMTDTSGEFPRSWFTAAKLADGRRDCSLNYFGVDASQPLSVWRNKGWVHPDDPRGWFQWYCRYYMGRRLPDEDRRQIKRWKAMQRHVRQIQRHCEPGDVMCRKRQRQALLHWAYDSRKI